MSLSGQKEYYRTAQLPLSTPHVPHDADTVALRKSAVNSSCLISEQFCFWRALLLDAASPQVFQLIEWPAQEATPPFAVCGVITALTVAGLHHKHKAI